MKDDTVRRHRRWLLLYGCVQLFIHVPAGDCAVTAEDFIPAQTGQDITAVWSYVQPEGAERVIIVYWYFGVGHSTSVVTFIPPSTSIAGPDYAPDKVDAELTDSEARLTIRNFSTSDEGKYRCEITFFAGGLSKVENTTAVVAVPAPPSPPSPSISGYAEGRLVASGSPLSMTCTSRQGKPPATLTWYKENTQLSAEYSSTTDDVGQGDATSVLTTSVLQPADNGGVYQCRASQLALAQVETSQITVSVAFIEHTTTITGYTAGTAVDSGDPLTLTCTSGSSNPAANITWSRDGGSAFTGTNNREQAGNHGGMVTSEDLVISLQPQHNGARYTCRATNSELSLDRESSVVGPLNVRFFQSGTTISGYTGPVSAGSDVTLTCTSGNSNPVASITWTRGGAAVTGTNNQLQDGNNGGKVTTQQLVLSNLQPGDNGTEVKCVAANSGLGLTQEDTVTIVVNYGPRNVYVTCNPSDLSDLREGGALVCTCTANSNPAARYSWRYGTAGSPPTGPPPTGALVDQAAGTIAFSTLDRTHSGEYRCTATNSIASAPSDDVTVDVKYPASITFITPPVTVDEYDDVSLTCTADSNPAPDNFSWAYMDGMSLTTSADGFSLTTTITAITYQQAGMYTCTAGNGIGDAALAGTNVTVEYRPKFYPSTGPYPAAVGADVSMECSAFAVPNEITFSWSKDGRALTNSDRLTIQSSGRTSVLTISGVVEGDYGMYNCTARNGKGSSTTTRTLQPLGPPDAPTNLKIITKNPEGDVTVQWTAGFNGGLETTHIVDYRKQGVTAWTSGATKIQPVSETHINYSVSLQLGSQGNFTIRIRTSNENGTLPAVTVDVLIEDETVLVGKLTVDQDFHADYNNLDSQRSQDVINELVTGLDETMRQANLPGYRSSRVVKLSPGSVVVDFETTVSKSEVQRAISAFDDQVQSGSLGRLSVVEGKLEERASVGGDNTTVIIIAAVVTVVVLLAVIGGGVFIVRRRKSANIT